MAESSDKKQILLRLNARLAADLTAWAEDEFRSLNGQIEFLLREAVQRRRKTAAAHDDGEPYDEDSDTP
ncbi:MAG: Arc family DNA-binding protein [Oscillospiraceae bacterium]|jgi:hypothetical protein|nr:Arc family DNA-binding protein [Oscillospiraceae bacterium]